MLAMLYVLLGFSVIVSLFGMVNTMVLSVFERTREIGMLRTIGMTRRQARRMIRHESVITALIGAALGLGLGLFLAALVTQAGRRRRAPLAVPVPALVAFTLVAVARRHRRGDHARPAAPRGSTCWRPSSTSRPTDIPTIAERPRRRSGRGGVGASLTGARCPATPVPAAGSAG